MRKLFPVISPILFIFTVVILGFVTPEYNHLNYTISRLAIMKYGWIQAINLLQFAYGLYLGGLQVSQTMQTDAGKRVIRNTFFFCSGILVLTALTRTDPVENLQMNLLLLSPMGISHYIVILLFLITSPFGISAITKTLAHEPKYRRYANLTFFMGLVSFAGSIMWFVFFYLGLLLPYRGLTQKLIVLWTIIWIILINYRAFRDISGKTQPSAASQMYL